MLKKLTIFCIILFAFSLKTAFGQNTDSAKATLKGTISSETTEILSGASISIIPAATEIKYLVYSGNNGEYSISLPAGSYNITVQKTGYEIYEAGNIYLAAGDVKVLNIFLIEKSFTTEEIDVEGKFRQSQDDLRTSLINITPKSVKILPGAIEDVMRSLKSLPGVTSPNDFTSQLVVRGSGPDQNLIIMDDVEIFNPYRLYGLVSMFNPETLSDITLITGGFPSKYGDRLSAVLDVLNREGTTERPFKFNSNVNIASANLIFEGKNPLKIPGSWIVSTRRTYYDLILGPFAKSAGLITEDSSFPSFEDLQFKLAFGPFDKHKFLVNGIFSKDAVDIISGEERTDPDSVNVNDVTKNDVVALAWHYIPNSNFISRTNLSWYRNSGENDFEGDILDPLIDKEGLTPAQRDSLKQIGALLGLEFDSRYFFRKFSLVNKSVYLDKSKNAFEFGAGVDMIRTDLTYNLKVDEQFKAILQGLPNAQALLEEFNIEGKDNYRGNIYAQGRFDIGRKFFYQPSIRLDYYSLLQKFYPSPRVSFGYIIDPLTTIRSSVGVYYQSPGYEKLMDRQSFYDLTPEVGKNLKAERSLHFVLGVERWLNSDWQAKVEGYYKKFDNLIAQQKLTGHKYEFILKDPNNTDPNYMRNPDNWVRSSEKIAYDSLTAIPVNDGTGNSYGIELSLEKKYNSPDTKFYGWVNYSYSFSNRERDGEVLPFRFDQRHVVNLVLNYRVAKWLEVGARWSYASNFPFTEPQGVAPRIVKDSLVVNPLTRQVVFNLDYSDESKRFASQKPAYHRLDVRVSTFANFWNTDWTFYLDVMNVYNRKNVIGYDYNLSNDLQISRKTIGMIPILPTLGVSARF